MSIWIRLLATALLLGTAPLLPGCYGRPAAAPADGDLDGTESEGSDSSDTSDLIEEGPPADGDSLPDGDEPESDSESDSTDSSDAPDHSDDEPPADGDLPADGDQESIDYPIGQIDVVWTACPLYDDRAGGQAECAEVGMPLFWGEPERSAGRTMRVAAKRLPSPTGAGAAQLWLLHGGPGASGTHDFPPMMERLQALYPELDLYTLDHRGVGRSDRLACPEQEAESSPGGLAIYDEEETACIAHLQAAYGDMLDAYTTSQSAIDTAALIEASREPGKRVLVWGGSYGTYIGQRYLQIFPDQADGLVLEGILPPDDTLFTNQAGYDYAGRQLLKACSRHPLCSQKIGPDPEAFMAALLDKLDAGHCRNLGLDRTYVRYLGVWLAYYGPINAVVPPLLYRLDRCGYDDMLAIIHLYDTLFGDNGDFFDFDPSFSYVLNNHVVLSEMVTHPDWTDEQAILDYLRQVDEQALFGYNPGRAYLDSYARWPVYTDALYDNGWAVTAMPVLMLQGALDPATPASQAIRVGEHFAGPGQVWGLFAGSAHNVAGASPLASDPGRDCGEELFVSFLRDPEGPLDTSCLADLALPDFAGTPEQAAYFFGSVDFWENHTRKGRPTDPARLAALGERLRPLLVKLRREMTRDRFLPVRPRLPE